MTHYLTTTVIVAYWLLCGLTLFYIMINEETRQTKVNTVWDLGVSLIIGGLIMPLLVGATTIYFVARGRN